MAKSSGSGTANPWLAALVKHQFWLLALLAPLLLLPLLSLARQGLMNQIEEQRKAIDTKVKDMDRIRSSNPQHPNKYWEEEIETSTMRVKRETLREWKKFWESQNGFRVWPASLGADFLKAVSNLKPEGKLSRKWLELYQNNVRSQIGRAHV